MKKEGGEKEEEGFKDKEGHLIILESQSQLYDKLAVSFLLTRIPSPGVGHLSIRCLIHLAVLPHFGAGSIV